MRSFNYSTFYTHANQPIEQLDEPFKIPDNWLWVPFGEIVGFENGDRSKNYPNREEYASEGVAWINTGHINPDGTLSEERMNYITRRKFMSLNGGRIRAGDLVYCLRGATFGRTSFVEPFEEGAIASSLMIIRPIEPCSRRYIYNFLISPMGKQELQRFDNGTAQPNLSGAKVGDYRFPLPPLAEQKRIVAKVDELMALCDQLEAQLTTTRTESQQLLEACIKEAVA